MSVWLAAGNNQAGNNSVLKNGILKQNQSNDAENNEYRKQQGKGITAIHEEENLCKGTY
ncbi:hypothetical protein ACAK89_004734 [Salmonella enterica]|uniref:hypothetical protein n=1 Tax=Salmonella enterica TaxID=28901 RepID=UPI000B07EB4B|nr:hypothetical protein [Salmonella enterica]EDT0981835.1 hypothetical protein [Salmonella enterica subsp. enterica serovar Mikawasima]EHO2575407.1 hypothetical protein [Salmonella enterica]